MHQPTDRISHTTTFVTPVVEHWLEREIAPMTHCIMRAGTLPRSYISLLVLTKAFCYLFFFFLMEYCSLPLFTLSKNAAIVGSINIIDIHLVHNKK